MDKGPNGTRSLPGRDERSRLLMRLRDMLMALEDMGCAPPAALQALIRDLPHGDPGPLDDLPD